MCGTEEETGKHLVIACDGVEGIHRWRWLSWEEIADRQWWGYTKEGKREKVVVRDRVEDFFLDLDNVLRGC